MIPGVPVQPIVYVPSRKRILAQFVGALAFTAGCALILFAPHHSLKAVIASVIGIPFFGLCAVIIGIRLFHRGPELTVTDDGFESRRWGRVSWDEVALVTVLNQQVRGRTYKHVQVELKNPAATVSRMGRGARLLVRFNHRWGDHLFLSANMFPVPVEEVVAAMQGAHQRFLGFDPVPPQPSGSWNV
jgi:hypothetical protein